MRGNVSILAVLCAAAVCVQTAFGVAYDADTTVADAIPLDGEYEVEVASGVTVTYSGVITGTGPIRKKGAGTLVLTNPNNTFTAGVQISQGRVRADAEGCLGDGRIFIDGTVANTSNAKNGVTRQIRFNAVNATFANEILVEGKDPSAGYSPDNTFIDAAKSVTLTGPVTLTVNSNSGTCYSGISCGTTSDSSPVLHFTKPLTYTSGYLHIVSFGNMIFDEAVTVGTFVIGYNYQLTGTVCLNSPSNSFGTVTLAGSNLSLGDTNALGGATFGIARAGSGGENRTALRLNGHDQTVKGLTFDTRYTSYSTYITSTDPATLTLTGDSASKTGYQTLAGHLSFVLDAADHTSFVQTLSSRAHTMDGILAVSNGTLAVTGGGTFKKAGEVHVAAGGTLTADGTSSGIFASATNVVIDGVMTLGGNISAPLTDGTATLTLGTGENRLTMADTVVLRVKGLTVGTERKANGTYGLGGTPLAQLNGGAIVVDDGSAVIVDATWTGGGETNGIATAANWSTSPDVPDLAEGTTHATFASGGTAAAVDRAVTLYGINLSSAGGFTFADGGNGAFSLCGGALAAAEPSAGTTATYRFEVPICATMPQTWSIATNATVQAAAGVTDTMAGRLVKVGAGELSVAGESTFAGAFVHSNGTLRLSGRIKAPAGLEQGGAVKDGPYSLTVHGEVAGTKVVLDGVTVEKPVWMAGRGDVSSPSVGWFQVAPGTTNVFKEPARLYTNVGYLNLDPASALVFEKGVLFDSTVCQSNGTMIVRGGAMTADTGSGFYLRGGSIRLESPQNIIKVFRAYDARTIDLAVDYALTNRQLIVEGGYPNLLLHNTAQHFTSISTTFGVMIHGDYPSRLISGGDGGNVRASTTGCVSFVQCGAGTLKLMMKDHESTGDLVVSKGTLELDSDASWRCGTNVFVSGTGTFKMDASGQLNKKIAVIHVDDEGVISLPEGVRSVVRELRVNGKPAPAGVYGGEDAPANADKRYAAHFEGEGVLRVAFGGFVMTVR